MNCKERFSNWMGKNTAKGIIWPIVADYDLKQCVELKTKISKHSNKVYFIGVCLCMFFTFIALAYMGISSLLADFNLIELKEHDTTGLGILIGGLFIFMGCFGYIVFLSVITEQCNKRIKEIAGVFDGEETQGQN